LYTRGLETISIIVMTYANNLAQRMSKVIDFLIESVS